MISYIKSGTATDDVLRCKEKFCPLSKGEKICNATSSRINVGTDCNDLHVTIKYNSSHTIYPRSQDLKGRRSSTISITVYSCQDISLFLSVTFHSVPPTKTDQSP